MGTYPMKVLIDEHNNEFVPWVSADCIHTNDGLSFEEKFATKIDSSNLKEGKGITITKDGADCTFDVDFGASDNIIDNLDTTVAGQGPLDARQGNILKNMIPTIVDNLTTADPNKVLSANQGAELKKIAVPEGGSAGQVLKKATDDNHSLEWGDAADPNAIVGNGSIMKIIELTYAEYKTLESNGELKEDTEYHITDVENGTASYITEQQIQGMIKNNVVNNLNSSDSTKSLSAAQGKKINKKCNYSTGEEVVGTWLGKPLYRKVLLYGALEEGAYSHYIPNVDHIHFGNGTGGKRGDGYWAFNNYYNADDTSMFLVNTTQFHVSSKGGSKASEYVIVLEYTKTTDTSTLISSAEEAYTYAANALGGESNISSGYGLRNYSDRVETSPEGYACYICCIRDTAAMTNEAWVYVHVDKNDGIAFDSSGYKDYAYISNKSLVDTSTVYIIG